jgi:hypothetical protein
MPPRLRLYALLLRALMVVVAVATIVGFAFTDRIAGWLLGSGTAFTVVFLVLAFALVVWLDVASGNWAAEREIYKRAVRRLANFVTPGKEK